MSSFFLDLFNVSITAGWLILAVIALRLILKKAPKSINFILWALVAIRLVCPFSIESALSLIPSSKPLPDTIISESNITVNSGITGVDASVNSYLDAHVNNPAQVNPGKSIDIIDAAGYIWLAGLAVMLVYFAVSFFIIKKKTSASIRLDDNIRICDDIGSPFILGVFRPKIYLPSGMSNEQMDYVISHEKAHLRHMDNLWKPIGFIILSVYWFNPLIWAAYILLCRDIELACDERVIRNMDKESMAGYSQAM